jgi:2-keto-4-pentenoate hydratase/2-oxohepta-3-ene-1,7-dioic acid hydratase in catechol pathway
MIADERRRPMKLVRFGTEGNEKPGVIDDGGTVRDVSALVDDYGPETLAPALFDTLRRADLAALPAAPADVRLGAPLKRVGHFIAIGLNYAEHAAETGAAVPTEPVVFSKAPSCVCGPTDDILIPRGSTKLDWESAPTFGPLGPFLATADEIPDPQSLAMFLDVNGERRQTGHTSTMIFPVAFLVSYLSRFMVLQPGDVIATGTPPGVGAGMSPQQFLRHGDEVRLGIDGLGEQRHKVAAR